MHKLGNTGIIAKFVLRFLQFLSLFATYDDSKYEMKCQWI